MKKLILSLLFLLSMTALATAQPLSLRHQHLARLAALEAQGDLTRLLPALHGALADGVTVAEIKEAFSQLYAYTGFPRSLNALGVLAQVIEQRRASGQRIDEGQPWQRPALWDNPQQSLAAGTAIQTRLSGQPFNYTFCPQNDYYLKAHLFGDIFASTVLSPADREIVTVAALSALRGVTPQLEAHKRGAVNLGNSPATVEALCRFLSEQGLSLSDAAADAQAGPWPQGSPNDAYAQYFIGHSFVAPVTPANLADGQSSVLPFVNVTFEPRCRNNWHIHHGAHQILICVSGRGWYQEWGKEPIELLPGMVIDIPEGVKHWHGAQSDSWFQHVTAHVNTSDNVSNQWLEAVTDDYYDNLPSNK